MIKKTHILLGIACAGALLSFQACTPESNEILGLNQANSQTLELCDKKSTAEARQICETNVATQMARKEEKMRMGKKEKKKGERGRSYLTEKERKTSSLDGCSFEIKAYEEQCINAVVTTIAYTTNNEDLCNKHAIPEAQEACHSLFSEETEVQ